MTKNEPKGPGGGTSSGGGNAGGGKAPDRRDGDDKSKGGHTVHSGTPDGAKGAGGRPSTTENPSGSGRGNNPSGMKKE